MYGLSSISVSCSSWVSPLIIWCASLESPNSSPPFIIEGILFLNFSGARASNCPISQAFGDPEMDESVSGRACCSSCSSKGSDGTGLGSSCGFGVDGGLCKSSNSMEVIEVSGLQDRLYRESSRISRQRRSLIPQEIYLIRP